MKKLFSLVIAAGILFGLAGTAAAEDTAPSLLATTPVSATADDGRSPIDALVGHLGLGYFTGDAPLGVRYWWNRENGFDINGTINFASSGVDSGRYGLEIGYVRALAHYHYSVVFARAGVGARYTKPGGSNSARTDGVGSLFIGAELFLGAFGFPNVSLQGGYGIQANYVNLGGGSLAVSSVDGGLSVVNAGNVGFHIYW
jgi:hypothetical protein